MKFSATYGSGSTTTDILHLAAWDLQNVNNNKVRNDPEDHSVQNNSMLSVKR